jgi:hypothetical protein
MGAAVAANMNERNKWVEAASLAISIFMIGYTIMHTNPRFQAIVKEYGRYYVRRVRRILSVFTQPSWRAELEDRQRSIHDFTSVPRPAWYDDLTHKASDADSISFPEA